MNYREFAKSIKEKYPQYSEVDDELLAKKMVEKYPSYAEKVSFDVQQEIPETPTLEDMTFSPEEREKYAQTATGQLPIEEQHPLQRAITAPARAAIAPVEAFGRTVGGGLSERMRGDEGLSGVKAFGQEFGDQLSKSYFKDPQERGAVTGFLTSPELPATITAPASLGRGVGQLVGGMPKMLGRAVTGTAEGAMEEAISTGDIGAGALLGGAFNLGSGKVADIAYDKFKDLPTNKAFPNLTDRQKEAAISETYENLGGKVDYNIPKRLDEIATEKARLGAMKEGGIREAQKIAGDLPQVEYGALKGADQQISNEIERVNELIKKGDATQEQASEYFGYVDDLSNQFLKERVIPDVELPKDVKSYMNVLEESEVGESITNLDKLFKLRKTLDSEYSKKISKLAGGSKNITKDEAVMFTRNVLNDRIDMVMDETREELSRRVAQGVADKDTYKSINALEAIDKTLEETKGLPSLYRQEKVLKNIGGGRTSKASKYGIGASGLGNLPMAKSILPPSGIRERQLSEIMKSQPVQSFGKDYFWRDQ